MSSLDEIIRLLKDANCIKLGEFTLSSGAKSRIYIDLRSILSHPAEFKSLVKICSNFIKRIEFDILAGIESSGIPFATALAIENSLPMIYVRKEVKQHGLRKQIEGDFKPGLKALLIDDVATTGSSLLKAIEALRSEGIQVYDAFVVVDRGEGAKEKLASVGVRLNSLITLGQILSRLKLMESRLGGVWKC